MPDLVDDGSAPGDQPIPNTMDRLQVQLVVGLDRDKPHVLTFDGFSDSLGINEVVLVGLHKRLHELRRDQPHFMALLLQCSTEKVSS